MFWKIIRISLNKPSKRPTYTASYLVSASVTVEDRLIYKGKLLWDRGAKATTVAKKVWLQEPSLDKYRVRGKSNEGQLLYQTNSPLRKLNVIL